MLHLRCFTGLCIRLWTLNFILFLFFLLVFVIDEACISRIVFFYLQCQKLSIYPTGRGLFANILMQLFFHRLLDGKYLLCCGSFTSISYFFTGTCCFGLSQVLLIKLIVKVFLNTQGSITGPMYSRGPAAVE